MQLYVVLRGKVLFVGTTTLIFVAERSGSFYMKNRWLGGTLTNFKTISARVKYLRDLEMRDGEGSLDLLPKKEAILLRKEMKRLSENFEGIKEMRKVPEAIFVVSTLDDANAILEARAIFQFLPLRTQTVTQMLLTILSQVMMTRLKLFN